MGVVFGTLPEGAPSDVHLEGGRRAPKGYLQYLFSFFGPTKLPERRDKPAANNLTATGDCLLINADLVTLDLAGFTITGSGTGTAIQFTGPTPQVARHGFAVRNGTISGFLTAVQFIRVGGTEDTPKG